ncbi:MAG: DUF47 family protein [Candidatus Altimarinota bacterium]
MSILFPQNNKFDNLFLELAESIKDMVKLVHEFRNNFGDFERFAHKARIIEEQADDATHRILNELQTAFITPYDREDLHALVVGLDDVVDDLENVIQSFYMYDITEKRACIDEFAQLYDESAESIGELLKALFGKKKNKHINTSKVIVAIHTLEGQGDDIYVKNIREIFTKEKDPITLMKWRVAIENMEAAMDSFEQAANTIEGIKLKAS